MGLAEECMNLGEVKSQFLHLFPFQGPDSAACLWWPRGFSEVVSPPSVASVPDAKVLAGALDTFSAQAKGRRFKVA